MFLSFPDLKLKPDNLLSSNTTENIPAYLLIRCINRNKARQPQHEFEFGRSETKPSPCTMCVAAAARDALTPCCEGRHVLCGGRQSITQDEEDTET